MVDVSKSRNAGRAAKAKRAKAPAAAEVKKQEAKQTVAAARELSKRERTTVLGDGSAPRVDTKATKGTSPLAVRTMSGEDISLRADAQKVAKLLPQMLCDLGGVDDLAKLGVRPLVASAGKESLFNTLFGRDSIRMARDLQDAYPAVAKSTIIELAKLQGKKTNPKSEEEPGRIIHEFRSPEELEKMLKYNEGITAWEFPYYGSVDATPLWLTLLHDTVEKQGPALLNEVLPDGRTLKDAVAAAADWIVGRLDDPRGGGFLWVQRANPKGIENQVLEDSRDSIYYADGKLHPTELPYAPVAEQGYAYKALKDAAKLLDRTGDAAGAARLHEKADGLQARFLKEFWQDDMGTFAQAIGYDAKGQGTPMRTVASSPGQLLSTGILDGAESMRDRLVDRLFQPDMLAGAGIRTKSTTAARFLAGGYHNGTVWPTISLEIKDGLLREAQVTSSKAQQARAGGDEKRAKQLDASAKDLLAKATDLEDRAIRTMAKFPFFPEFLRGDPDGSIAINTEIVRKPDRDGIMNTLEQPPQPQGWTATAMDRVLRRRQSLLE